MSQEAELDRLCLACQNLFSSDPSVRTEVRSDASFANNKDEGSRVELEDGEALIAHLLVGAMLDSAQYGCHLCSLMIVDHRGGDLKRGDQVWMQFRRKHDYRCHSMLVMHVEEIDTRTWHGWAGYVSLHSDEYFGCSGEKLSPVATDRPSLFSTSSKETLDCITRWVRVCSESHDSCNKTIHNRFLPTRVLEVINDETFRLVESSCLPHDARYMTLSHCWGSNGLDFTLNQTSFDQLKEGVPIYSLPQTFRDAVHIVKGLCCPYLWIDALCIIQDDKSDWRRESSKMADVYLCSELNIAASVGTNSHQGIFRYRNPLKISPCIIHTSWNTTPKIFASIYHSAGLTIDRSHLNRRAWVLQERLLAPRVVHFGPTEVYWECNFSFCREAFPQQEASQAGDTAIKGCLAIGGSIGTDLDDPDNLLNCWRDIVKLYTAANLTYPSDKLAAISGLARQFATVSKGALGRYFAGLWEVEFIYQLGWCTNGPDKPLLPDYIAPSWSWASIQKPVYAAASGISYVRISDLAFVHLEQVQTSAIFDPFGPVNDGHIKLKGILCHLRMAFDIEKDIQLVDISGSSFLFNDFEIQHGSICIDRYPPFPEFAFGEHVECFILPLFQTQGQGGNGAPWEDLTGLLLRPTATKKGQFTRIGQITVTSTEARDAFNLAISEQIIEDQFFEELDERWGYLIEII